MLLTIHLKTICHCLIFSLYFVLKALLSFKLSELEELWTDAASQSVDRQSWILDLDGILASLEQQRMEKVKSV